MSENENRHEYCSLCGRSEADAGHLMTIPGGLKVCPDCMQKSMEMAEKMDFSALWQDPEKMQKVLEDMQRFQSFLQQIPTQSGSTDERSADPQTHTEDTPGEESGQKPEDSSAESGPRQEPPKGVQMSFIPPFEPYMNDSSEGEGDGEKKDEEKKGPNIQFMNLSDLMSGMIPGMQRRAPVKKKAPREKPVFTIDALPAPHKIKAKLDEYVVGQERAKRAISVAVYNHYKRVTTGHMDDIEIEKSNILLIGPTGCGKTYLVKTLARLLDVPLAIADATSLTEAGYIGDDIESVLSKLLEAADNDVEKAERGIVFVDEIDKIAKKRNMTSRDVNGESVQQGMLKLLEGAEVEVPVGSSSKNAMVPMATIDTRNILFICGGAFPDLDRIVKDRLTAGSGFGYQAELKDRYDDDSDLLSKVTTEDLRNFGFIPEFIGRLPVVCTLTAMDVPMLVRILKEPKNAIIKQYQRLLELDEVDLEFEDGALEAIAEKAIARETGARALRAIIEEIMMDIMYEVPKDENIGRVTITRAYVEGKGGPSIEIRTEPVHG